MTKQQEAAPDIRELPLLKDKLLLSFAILKI